MNPMHRAPVSHAGMMGTSGVEIVGLKELERRLFELAKEATDEEVDMATLGLAQEIAGKMKARAHPSLRYCIVAKPFTKKGIYQSSAFVAVDYKAKDAKGRIMAKLAHIFEFGNYKTSPRRRKKLKGRGGGLLGLAKVITGDYGSTGDMPRRPFFRPVIDEYRGEKFLTRMAAIVRSRIEHREFKETMGGFY